MGRGGLLHDPSKGITKKKSVVAFKELCRTCCAFDLASEKRTMKRRRSEAPKRLRGKDNSSRALRHLEAVSSLFRDDMADHPRG